MLGKILEIVDNRVMIKLAIDINEQPNLVNLHVVFENDGKQIVGQVVNITQAIMTTIIVGEIKQGVFVPGIALNPSFKSVVRLIRADELELIFGSQNLQFGKTNFGTSNVYEGYKINVNINDFFSNHFSILGNSGSGKSCTVASILQKLFSIHSTPAVNANIFFFDAYGEYENAFVYENSKFV